MYAEEFEAMSVEEREHAKIQPALNHRTYSPEEGIICMQDIPVKMRDGVTIYADIYKPEAEGKYPLIISWSFYGNVRLKDRQSGRSWEFRRTQYQICLSLKSGPGLLVPPWICDRKRRSKRNRTFRR